MSLPMKPGDILMVRGADWFSDAIDHLTGDAGVSHVGLLVCVEDPPGPVVIEALDRVKTRLLATSIAAARHAWAVTDCTLTIEQRRAVVARALSFTADPYNYCAIALQLLDSATRTRWFTEHFATTRVPICSMLDALAEEGAGVALPPADGSDRSITPNDFCRWVHSQPARFQITQLK